MPGHCHSHFLVFFCPSRPLNVHAETSDLKFAADKETIHSSLNTGHAFFYLFAQLAMQGALLLHFFEGENFRTFIVKATAFSVQNQACERFPERDLIGAVQVGALGLSV